jgi:hypothetical protein
MAFLWAFDGFNLVMRYVPAEVMTDLHIRLVTSGSLDRKDLLMDIDLSGGHNTLEAFGPLIPLVGMPDFKQILRIINTELNGAIGEMLENSRLHYAATQTQIAPALEDPELTEVPPDILDQARLVLAEADKRAMRGKLQPKQGLAISQPDTELLLAILQ